MMSIFEWCHYSDDVIIWMMSLFRWCHYLNDVIIQWCHYSDDDIIQMMSLFEWCHYSDDVIIQWCHYLNDVIIQWCHYSDDDIIQMIPLFERMIFGTIMERCHYSYEWYHYLNFNLVYHFEHEIGSCLLHWAHSITNYHFAMILVLLFWLKDNVE